MEVKQIELDPRYVILNAHRILRSRYRGKPLWAMVRDIGGVGSQTAALLCEQCGFDPDQNCGANDLKELKWKLKN